MTDFQLDARLAADCFQLGKLDGLHLLLMNNAEVMWLILVPETNEQEMYALPADELMVLNTAIRDLTAWLTDSVNPDKLNVAAIGNMVRQLHVHVVARHEGDYCWPGVVWGSQWQQRYNNDAVAQLQTQVQETFVERFIVA